MDLRVSTHLRFLVAVLFNTRASSYGAVYPRSLESSSAQRLDDDACEDNRSFQDGFGRNCEAWRGYNCTWPWPWYTTDQLQEILAQCPDACWVCNGKKSNAFIEEMYEAMATFDWCEDNVNFRDADNNSCADWAHYNCTSDEWGLSVDASLQLQTNCRTSCQLCQCKDSEIELHDFYGSGSTCEGRMIFGDSPCFNEKHSNIQNFDLPEILAWARACPKTCRLCESTPNLTDEYLSYWCENDPAIERWLNDAPGWAAFCTRGYDNGWCDGSWSCDPDYVWKLLNARAPKLCNTCVPPHMRLSCPPRTFRDEVVVRCSNCEVGRFQPFWNKTECGPCDLGFFSISPKNKCTFCGEGLIASRAGQVACTPCSAGRIPSDDHSICKNCDGGSYSDKIGAKSCKACDKLFHHVNDQYTDCVVHSLAFLACLAAATSLGLACSMLVANISVHMTGKGLVIISGLQQPVEDISTTDGRVMLKTVARQHGMYSRWKTSFPIVLTGTNHDFLDAQQLRARVIDSRTLELLDRNGSAVSEDCETSKGLVGLSLCQSLVHYGYPSALIGQILSLLAVAIIILLASSLSSNEVVVALILASLLPLRIVVVKTREYIHTGHRGRHYKHYHHRNSVLHASVLKYLKVVETENPKPLVTDPGPYRAIAFDKLEKFYWHFAEFIRNRNMYYVEPNLVRPLTVQWKLSLADVLGASRVLWFVSHWWGNEFARTRIALQKHATSMRSGVEREISYWICTFSNNQWKLNKEIPGALEESSFFKTLLSGFCEGVCLILDELATPLTRSWCLFEYLHAVELSESNQFDNFQGIYFCHDSGVLNHGGATVEVSLSLGDRLGNLRLEDATASLPEDKNMIDALVVTKMGSFENINRKLKHLIADTVDVARQETDAKFVSLASRLRRHLRQTYNDLPERYPPTLSI